MGPHQAEKRIFLLETGAKFAELYAIEYKKLIEQFIKRTITAANIALVHIAGDRRTISYYQLQFPA